MVGRGGIYGEYHGDGRPVGSPADFRREQLNEPIKPGTCLACKFFKAERERRHIDGWCHNSIATVGTVLQTSFGSSCKYHEPKL